MGHTYGRYVGRQGFFEIRFGGRRVCIMIYDN